ncbi:MAG: EamA family transporter [Deltaproteobacteria bacterium]|nr:EamA family transporter [Deltaproteobacteria bacterium]
MGTAGVSGITVEPASGRAFFYIVLAALVPQLIGHNILTWALRHTKPMVVSMAVVGEPVGATILGYFWLGESVAATTALGCAITLAAVLYAIASGASGRRIATHGV